jgi:two-component system, response regulator PdtaR
VRALWGRNNWAKAMFFGRRRTQISRLLLVEDEPLVAFDNEHALGDAGFTIVATVPGLTGAAAALGREIDLVVSDVRLADGSGVEVARAAQAAGVPVLFVTGACPAEAEALAAGCLAKPYAPKDLVAAIRAIDAALQGERVRRLPPGFSLFVDRD